MTIINLADELSGYFEPAALERVIDLLDNHVLDVSGSYDGEDDMVSLSCDLTPSGPLDLMAMRLVERVMRQNIRWSMRVQPVCPGSFEVTVRSIRTRNLRDRTLRKALRVWRRLRARHRPA